MDVIEGSRPNQTNKYHDFLEGNKPRRRKGCMIGTTNTHNSQAETKQGRDATYTKRGRGACLASVCSKAKQMAHEGKADHRKKQKYRMEC